MLDILIWSGPISFAVLLQLTAATPLVHNFLHVVA
jgi:hypothetical protein